MTIVSCPKCGDQVSVPSGVNGETRVRCPLCREEYSLASALALLPPLLEVIHDHTYSTHQVYGSDPEYTSTAARGAASVAAAPDEHYESPPEVGVATTDSAPAPMFRFEEMTQSAPSISVASRGRPRRKKSGPVKALVQIVGGGVLGLLIAQVILWWIPGKWERANRDPLGVADTVAKYVPFILPAQLRTPSGMSGSQGTAPVASTRDLADNKSEDSASATAQDSFGNPSTDAPPLSDGENPPAMEPTPTVVQEAPPPVSETAINAAAPPTTPLEKTTEPIVLRHAMLVEPAEIGRRLTRAEQANGAWDAAPNATNSEKVVLLGELYDSLARVGEACVLANPTDSQSAQESRQLQQWLKPLETQTDKLNFLARYAAARWLDESGRSHAGVALYGTVVAQDKFGALPGLRIKLASKDEREISIVAGAAAPTPPPGSRVFILGMIVPEPVKNLEGYEGASPEIIVSGHLLTLPAP